VPLLPPLPDLLARAIHERVFPAAVAEVGDRERVLWRGASGALTFEQGAPAVTEHTPFDLASLTKPIATTSLAMQHVAAGRLSLSGKVADLAGEWRGGDRVEVTIRDLLEHASGLAARLVDQPPQGRREFQHEICAMPLEYAPREKSIYSDLGFILLGFLIEDAGGASLSDQFDTLCSTLPVASSSLRFGLPSDLRALVAPTVPLDEDSRRGRSLAGEVHDNYAASLGGVAGHAGLFGTAPAVGNFARVVLRGAMNSPSPAPFTYQHVMQMIKKSTVPGSSRALGWDTMLPTSSCGERMSFAAFGHVGFTGTSLWIDPILDRYFVLLTNRACGGGTLEQMKQVRRAFHDAAVEIG
jgi:CubicO group peptidase (beta-lactamase class C family)